MDFTPIYQLDLKKAFSDNSKFQNINNGDDFLTELFECEDRGLLFVFDDSDKGHSTYVENTFGLGLDKVFKIHNKQHKDVFLWHIDGVLFTKDSKCDCAILTDVDMDFIEFKSNAINNTKETIKKNYEKASCQLLITIKEVSEKCKSAGVQLGKVVNVKAFAVFNRSVPKNDAFRKSISAKFLKDSNGIKLFFDNETTLTK